ncbi:DUF6090 family protein [Mangrovimonas sp. DI 80]|uniref:DUF6090 family protein n=1 Tax=Mangrovimonas sp. DI 80 TaxID=1779330 RepID=UPI00097666AB|nr:DUF6090 family protein [Mangrovimonas sp. DI 80]OMP30498.1 hypothetical protein BKM32_14100 [Mangrovimonas sp. DI 80]
MAKLKIDWKSKIIDLLIVIIGITIAFKLNNWNDSFKTELEAKGYIESFYEENKANYENLVAAIDFANTKRKDIDSLKNMLLSGNYSDNRIKSLSASMLALTDFNPSTTTMENITASGEFDMIKDLDLRKDIISTYNSYKTTTKLEALIADYINDYVTPFFFENVRFRDFGSINPDFIKDPHFENIVLGYEVLLNQQINGYQSNLEKQKLLDESLTSANNRIRQ